VKKKSRLSKSKAAISDDDDDDDNDAKPLKPTPKPRKKSVGSAKKRKYGKQNVYYRKIFFWLSHSTYSSRKFYKNYKYCS